ncbi:hypothetical protein MUK42_34009 [Musa troglodytarum]|uniref:Uncharacterized protein n=1 Tax=Musa troglodytarum TaxID=320322 RepID=A0A9E7FQX7_9LILI|nr:hypothetical protein MUK42_34009 [Musa troglodytarum]
MACPIVVFGHSHADDWMYHSEWEVQKAMLPFVEGSKKKMRKAFIQLISMHNSQLQLQPLLHSWEVSSAVSQENRQRSYSDSLKLLTGKEVWHLIEADAIEEQK